MACDILKNWPASNEAIIVANSHIFYDEFPSSSRCEVARAYLEIFDVVDEAVREGRIQSLTYDFRHGWDFRRGSLFVLMKYDESEWMRDYHRKVLRSMFGSP